MRTASEDQAYEATQALVVQTLKKNLAAKLAVFGRASPGVDLADLASRAIEAYPDRADRVEIAALRSAYVEAVNRLWLYAENAGLTARLTGAWMRTNRRNLAGVDRAEYSAEATFAMRHAVVNYTGKGPLVTFAFMYVKEALAKVRDAALEFDRLPEGANPTAGMIDDVTPETVLVAKRHLAATGSKEGA